jgi:3-keto-L-gulonate-6-phosphate decarboxylase
MIKAGTESLEGISHIAAAGGIRLETIPFIRQAGIETVIVGSAITKSGDIAQSVSDFKKSLEEKF